MGLPSLRNSNNSPASPVPTRCSTSDVAKLIARCLANYGERKGADMRLVTAEWHASLFCYSPDRLSAALSEHIRRSTFWPTVANLLDILREQSTPPGRGIATKQSYEFARDGRTEAEEIAHRAAQCIKWREEARVNLKPTDDRKE